MEQTKGRDMGVRHDWRPSYGLGGGGRLGHMQTGRKAICGEHRPGTSTARLRYTRTATRGDQRWGLLGGPTASNRRQVTATKPLSVSGVNRPCGLNLWDERQQRNSSFSNRGGGQTRWSVS